jgi:hypothetical protein
MAVMTFIGSQWGLTLSNKVMPSAHPMRSRPAMRKTNASAHQPSNLGQRDEVCKLLLWLMITSLKAGGGYPFRPADRTEELFCMESSLIPR